MTTAPQRKTVLPIAASVVLMLLLSQGDTTVFSQQESSDCELEERWREVLTVARNRQSDSKERLEKIARSESKSRVVVLAQGILQEWRNENNTFYSTRPKLLQRIHFSAQDFEEAVPNIRGIAPRHIVAQVGVDAEGCVTSVDFLRGGDVQAIRDLVVDRIMQAVFLPAKPEQQYVSSQLTLMWRIEVY